MTSVSSRRDVGIPAKQTHRRSPSSSSASLSSSYTAAQLLGQSNAQTPAPKSRSAYIGRSVDPLLSRARSPSFATSTTKSRVVAKSLNTSGIFTTNTVAKPVATKSVRPTPTKNLSSPTKNLSSPTPTKNVTSPTKNAVFVSKIPSIKSKKTSGNIISSTTTTQQTPPPSSIKKGVNPQTRKSAATRGVSPSATRSLFPPETKISKPAQNQHISPKEEQNPEDEDNVVEFAVVDQPHQHYEDDSEDDFFHQYSFPQMLTSYDYDSHMYDYDCYDYKLGNYVDNHYEDDNVSEKTRARKRWEESIRANPAVPLAKPEKIPDSEERIKGGSDEWKMMDHVMEETVNKLSAGNSQESKVKVLVGAFEKVISLTDQKIPNSS